MRHREKTTKKRRQKGRHSDSHIEKRILHETERQGKGDVLLNMDMEWKTRTHLDRLI